MRLSRIEAKYPLDATEVRSRSGNATAIYRIRDLTAAYKDLTDDMPKAKDESDDPLMRLFERMDREIAGDV